MAQRTWTIELTANIAGDAEKEAITQNVQMHARAMLASCQLVPNLMGQPRIEMYSDDFYGGHEGIELLPDTLAQGVQDTSATAEQDQPVSQELLDALRDM